MKTNNSYIVLFQPKGTETVDHIRAVDAWASTATFASTKKAFLENGFIKSYEAKHGEGKYWVALSH